jgi:hypothetical protein
MLTAMLAARLEAAVATASASVAGFGVETQPFCQALLAPRLFRRPGLSIGYVHCNCNCHLPPQSMRLLGVARANTAVGVSPETFLLHQVVGGLIPVVAMVWRPALAVWFDSTLCPGGCQRVWRGGEKVVGSVEW